MRSEAKRINNAAIQLPKSERTYVAAILADTRGEDSAQVEIDAAWLAEVRRRRDDLDAGRTRAVPWEDVRAKIHAKIERARKLR